MVAEVIVDEGTEHLSAELGIGVIWRRTMRKRSCELNEGELDFGDTKPAAQTLSSWPPLYRAALSVQCAQNSS